MVFQIVLENERGAAPSRADLQGWATEYGLTMPVLADPGMQVLSRYATSSSIGLPFTVLLDRGVVVADVNYPDERDFRALLR